MEQALDFTQLLGRQLLVPLWVFTLESWVFFSLPMLVEEVTAGWDNPSCYYRPRQSVTVWEKWKFTLTLALKDEITEGNRLRCVPAKRNLFIQKEYIWQMTLKRTTQDISHPSVALHCKPDGCLYSGWWLHPSLIKENKNSAQTISLLEAKGDEFAILKVSCRVQSVIFPLEEAVYMKWTKGIAYFVFGFLLLLIY